MPCESHQVQSSLVSADVEEGVGLGWSCHHLRDLGSGADDEERGRVQLLIRFKQDVSMVEERESLLMGGRGGGGCEVGW